MCVGCTLLGLYSGHAINKISRTTEKLPDKPQLIHNAMNTGLLVSHIIFLGGVKSLGIIYCTVHTTTCVCFIPIAYYCNNEVLLNVLICSWD